MSIIYDALQKTQRNLSNKRKANFLHFTKYNFSIIDVLLVILIVLMLGIAVFCYYPMLKERFHHQQTAISKPIKQPLRPSLPKVPVMVQPNIASIMPVALKNTGRDPFQMVAPSHISATLPAANLTKLNNKLVLNGVFISELEKIALINNQSYHVGEMVQGFKIISIDMDSVKLSDDKNSFILHTTA